MRYLYPAKVKKVEQRRELLRARKTGKKLDDGKDEVNTEYEDLGWFVTLNIGISLSLGDAKPDLQIGDDVRLVLET